MPTAPRKYFMPSVIGLNALASCTVSQMGQASLSFGIVTVHARQRDPHFMLAGFMLLH